MTNTVLIKRSGTANAIPTAGQLSLGELAINYNDGNLFYKNAGGAVTLLTSNQFVSVPGNITGGNLNAVGLSLSGNVLSAINLTSNITTTANISGGNVLGGANVNATTHTGTTVSVTGNITGGNILGGANVNATTHTGTTVSVTGNVTGGNILTAGLISATGNIITGSNIVTGGGSGGNLTGANVISATTLSASSNVTGGNLNAVGLSLSGNVVSALVSAANITTTANIAGNYFIGNGSLLTGIAGGGGGSSISNGTSNVTVVSSGGNVAVGVGGTSNVVVFANTGAYITGVVSASGNVNGFELNLANLKISTNLRNTNQYVELAGLGLNHVTLLAPPGKQASQASDTFAQLYWTSNIANVDPFDGNDDYVWAYVSSSGFTVGTNSTGGSLLWDKSTGVLSTGGNVNGSVFNGNVAFDIGTVSGTGNVTGGNLNAAGLSLSGNVVSALVSAANITTTANISGNYFIGDGSQLTGITASAGAAITNGTSNVTVSGSSNITANVAGSAIATWATSGEYITGLISATGNITGNYFIGNGSALTGITAGTTTFSNTAPVSPAVGDVWIQANTAIQYIYFNDDTSNQWAEMEAYQSFSGGGGMAWAIANSNITLSANNGYFVDTSGGAKTMTLPASATIGDTVRINDLAGTFSSNNLTVARNGSNIQGVALDLVVSVDQSSFGLVYSNGTYGWKLLEL
jgi:hypothetical protein